MKPNIDYILKYATPADKAKVAYHNDVDDSYIRKILNGARDAKSEKARQILIDLHICATINEVGEAFKETELTKAA